MCWAPVRMKQGLQNKGVFHALRESEPRRPSVRWVLTNQLAGCSGWKTCLPTCSSPANSLNLPHAVNTQSWSLVSGGLWLRGTETPGGDSEERIWNKLQLQHPAAGSPVLPFQWGQWPLPPTQLLHHIVKQKLSPSCSNSYGSSYSTSFPESKTC